MWVYCCIAPVSWRRQSIFVTPREKRVPCGMTVTEKIPVLSTFNYYFANLLIFFSHICHFNTYEIIFHLNKLMLFEFRYNICAFSPRESMHIIIRRSLSYLSWFIFTSNLSYTIRESPHVHATSISITAKWRSTRHT